MQLDLNQLNVTVAADERLVTVSAGVVEATGVWERLLLRLARPLIHRLADAFGEAAKEAIAYGCQHAPRRVDLIVEGIKERV